MKQLVRNSIAPMAVGVGGTVFVVGVASVLLAQNFWLADLLVNFQVQFMMCMLVCVFALVLCRRQLTAAAYLMGTLFLALPIIPYLKIPFRETNVAVPTGDEKVYRLLTYNVLRSNTRTQDVADYLGERLGITAVTP